MTLTLGRLAIEDPTAFPEAVGHPIGRVGATPVPGQRAGLSVAAGLETFAPGDATAAGRRRLRRQLRSMLNNATLTLGSLYLVWDEDAEQDGWYVPSTATIDVAGPGALAAAFWRVGGLELALIGRPRTHRRAVEVRAIDRRLATSPRDQLARVYSTDFAAQTAAAIAWLPSNISDPIISSYASLGLTAARTGYGSASIQGVLAAQDLAVVGFEQAAAARNRGDVVVYDRRGTLTGPTSGPDSAWEEVYGPDWPCASAADWISAADVPVLDNGLVRVRYDSANTDGLAIDRWTGSAWAEQGKVLIQRVGASTAYCDTLVSAGLVSWTPERAVVRLVMRLGSDAYSREEVYVSLQRGWSGPRFEVYPGPVAAGTPAGAGVHVFRIGAPSGTETANKHDATLQTVTGVPSFTAGAVGAATFTGQNWILMRRSGVNAIALAAVQAGATGRVENNSSAYGSARNGIAVRAPAGTGYVSALLGMNAASDTTAIDSTNSLYDGSRELGQHALYDVRTTPTLVAR